MLYVSSYAFLLINICKQVEFLNNALIFELNLFCTMIFKKQQEINKRYITNLHLEHFLKTLNNDVFTIKVAGKSVLENNIYRIDFGRGKYKVLLWSQMHGNETTTTRAIFNIMKKINSGEFADWLSYFSFTFIPILNPDGAEAFTRVNANKIDLNRDSKELTQPEAQILRAVYNQQKPDLALNMHDQRSIFSAGITQNPATLSFLAPSYNDNREINNVRTYAMKLIAMMREGLKEATTLNIGRFDDSFNVNCIGDMFTHLGTPTILFEAGFATNDYQRQTAVNWVEKSLECLFYGIIKEKYQNFSIENYMDIPENQKHFVDLIIYNFSTTNNQFKDLKQIPIIFKEFINKNELILQPTIDFESAPQYQYAHAVLDAKNQLINSENDVLKLLKNITIS